VVNQVILGPESGYGDNHKIIFEEPRTVDYRASVPDIAKFLNVLMHDAPLRDKMGMAGRRRVVAQFDYRVVAKKFVQIINDVLGIQ